MSSSPFDHERDAELGDALRRALSADDDAVFIRRVVARLTEVEGLRAVGTWWDVLGGWARPGLAAAAVGVLAAMSVWLLGVRPASGTDVILDNPLQPAADAFVTSALLTTTEPPAVDVVLGIALESTVGR